MEKYQKILDKLSRLNPHWVAQAEKWLTRLPAFKKRLRQETDTLLEEIGPALKPTVAGREAVTRLPASGRAPEAILDELEIVRRVEAQRWEKGFASGAVYHGGQAHVDFLNRVYALYSQSNPLHIDLWPSTVRFESEIVAMTAGMLGQSENSKDRVCGSVTSGGTESILLAMKAYRDRARQKGIRRPEIVAPQTAHAAFEKAAHLLAMPIRRVAVDSGFRVDLQALRATVNRRTAVVACSAPSFPHGVIDPVAQVSQLARSKGIGCHVDACLGGFILPFAAQLGYPIAAFDFRLPGVTSMSADTHKYGYAAKGTSVVLYRHKSLRRYQYYTAPDWPGGLYFSPTLAGSRPGGLIAACWAAMVSIGREGYLRAAHKILETAAQIKTGLSQIPEIRILGDPLWVIAFASDAVDIYRVLDAMVERGWSLNGLHRPACVHLCVTLRHTQPGVAERFLEDLRAAVDYVKNHPGQQGQMAPIYGMAATLPLPGTIDELLKGTIDAIYEP